MNNSIAFVIVIHDRLMAHKGINFNAPGDMGVTDTIECQISAVLCWKIFLFAIIVQFHQVRNYF